jgi:hypothetical protein
MTTGATIASASGLLPARLLETHARVVDRARAAGAASLILTGSTARSSRTPISDLDYHVIGPRFTTHDLPEELDLRIVTPTRFRELLDAGDDFTHWSLRFGRVIFDDGTVAAGVDRLERERLWPDVVRKRSQAERSLRTARAMVDSGDHDAAVEQVRTALTLTARWRLLAAGQFPLSRSELPGQLHEEGLSALAGALSAAIHGVPSLEHLRADVIAARRVLDEPLRRRDDADLPVAVPPTENRA